MMDPYVDYAALSAEADYYEEDATRIASEKAAHAVRFYPMLVEHLQYVVSYLENGRGMPSCALGAAILALNTAGEPLQLPDNH